jgi:hypothetical protein
MASITLISNAIATGAGPSQLIVSSQIDQANKTFQATGTTTSGTGAVAVAVEVSNDNTNWIAMGTISLTLGTTIATDGFVSIASWTYVRGNVTSISGTGATVSLFMGL